MIRTLTGRITACALMDGGGEELRAGLSSQTVFCQTNPLGELDLIQLNQTKSNQFFINNA